MLIVKENGGIRLTRGDTAKFMFTIVNQLTKEPYVIKETDKITFTVKKTVRDTQYCFQKEVIGTDRFAVLPSDTEPYPFGVYYYDLQLTKENGEVYTVIPPTSFEIMPEVTY